MKLIKFASIAFAVLTLVITLVFMTWWAFKEQAMFGSQKFDQTSWAQLMNSTQQDCKRGQMAYDLKTRILIPGAPKEAVTALLGRPSIEEDTAMEYDLGKCMQVYHALRIYFDAQNRLTHTQISSH